MQAKTTPDVLSRVSQAVWDVVADRGIEGTTVRSVAEQAGCTTGLIMHHFRSRAALLVHARRTLFGRTTEAANRAEASARSARLAVNAVLETALPVDVERASEVRVWLGFAAAAVNDPGLAEVHAAGNRDWLDRITRLVGAARGDLAPEVARARAMQLVAHVDGVAALAVLDPATYPPSVQRKGTTDLTALLLDEKGN